MDGVNSIMQSHKFKIGRTVQMVANEHRLTSLGSFEILLALPIERGIPQYRLKSLTDGHQRVALESELA